MLLHRKSVELLAPAGTWDAMTAAIDAGADAVYLGGKHFNMRLHEGDFNFDDARLKEAIDYAHAHIWRRSAPMRFSYRTLPCSSSCTRWASPCPCTPRS